MYHLSNYERETIINFNEAEATASVYTHNRALIRKLETLAQERPEDCHLEKTSHDGQAVDYTIPKSWVRINPPRNAAPLTEEQKQQRREQLAKLRDSGSNSGRAHQEQAQEDAGEGKDTTADIPIENTRPSTGENRQDAKPRSISEEAGA